MEQEKKILIRIGEDEKSATITREYGRGSINHFILLIDGVKYYFQYDSTSDINRRDKWCLGYLIKKNHPILDCRIKLPELTTKSL